MSIRTHDSSMMVRRGGLLLPTLFAGYAGLFPALLVVLRAPGMMPGGSELGVARATFAAVSVCTLSGFHTTIGSDDLLPAGHAAVFVFTLAATFFVLSIGAIAVNRLAGLGVREDRVLPGVAGFLAVFTTLGAVGLCASGANLNEAASLSLAALANSAAGTSHAPGVSDWRTHLIVLPLMTIGGLGVPATLLAPRRHPFARQAILLTAGAYLIGVAGLALLYTLSGTDRGGVDVFLSSSVASLNTRGGGWDVEPVSTWPRAVQGFVVVLMSVGGVAGGTAGGIGLTTLALVVVGVKKALAGRVLSPLVGVTLLWSVIFVALVVVTCLLLLAAEPSVGVDRVLFLSAAAVSNVGLAHDTVSITGSGMWVLDGAMLAGRFLPLALMTWGATRLHAETADD